MLRDNGITKNGEGNGGLAMILSDDFVYVGMMI